MTSEEDEPGGERSCLANLISKIMILSLLDDCALVLGGRNEGRFRHWINCSCSNSDLGHRTNGGPNVVAKTRPKRRK